MIVTSSEWKVIPGQKANVVPATRGSKGVNCYRVEPFDGITDPQEV